MSSEVAVSNQLEGKGLAREGKLEEVEEVAPYLARGAGSGDGPTGTKVVVVVVVVAVEIPSDTDLRPERSKRRIPIVT